ncbi:MAG: hypothetical protein R3C60_14250 [Parvularculaceae bacterium]
MCLRLPRWPTDRRAAAGLSPEGTAPFVLYEKSAGALRIYAACGRAFALGLRPGMALSDARALTPNLVAEAADVEADRAAFIKLGDWLTRYSPLVTPVEITGFLIDITGAAHLFLARTRSLMKRSWSCEIPHRRAGAIAGEPPRAEGRPRPRIKSLSFHPARKGALGGDTGRALRLDGPSRSLKIWDVLVWKAIGQFTTSCQRRWPPTRLRR